MEANMKTYIGKITNFIYKAPNSRFAIAVFILFNDEKRSLTIKGNISELQVGKYFTLEGEMEVDVLKKRKTFNVVKVTPYISDEKEYIIKYFASSTFPGIGLVNATEIAEFYLKEYKSNVIENIISHPEHLEEL